MEIVGRDSGEGVRHLVLGGLYMSEQGRIETGNLVAESRAPCTGWNDFAGPTQTADGLYKPPRATPPRNV